MFIHKNLVLIGLLLAASAQADERRYLASMDEASWRLSESSAILCRLEHPIPRFGSAIFTREAGRPLRLELKARKRFKRGINVELRSESNSWNRRQARTVLARFETSGRKTPFKISPRVAARTFDALRGGFKPGFLFYSDTPFIASLSTVMFGKAEKEFNSCVAQLHDTNFEDVRVSSIYFEPDHEFASIEQEESAFDRMFDYLQVDAAISEIVVTGHADKTGLACYNEGLSERRAWYVYDLLIAYGLDPDMLRVGYLGETRPLNKERNERARAANRRVTVELRR